MGGRDGARGYLYQSIVTVIDSLSDQLWEKVTLEPATNDEKIDMLWEYPECVKKVTQVKSTKGSIGSGKIKEILNSMIKDEPDAEEYELVIVGKISKGAEILKEQLDQAVFSAEDSIFEGLRGYLNKIKIRVEDFSISSMESTIYKHVDKFFFANSPSIINPDVKEIYVKALICQFITFSTEGRTLTREDLNKVVTLKGDNNNWRYLDIESIVHYTVYLVDRFHDANLEEKMKIIKMFGQLEEVFCSREGEQSDIYNKAMVFKNNHLTIYRNLEDLSIEEGKAYLDNLGTDGIYIYTVREILIIIASMLAILSPSYRTKGKNGEIMMKDIDDIDNEAIMRFDKRFSKREFMIEAIRRGYMQSYYDGIWHNPPSLPVW